MEWEEALCRRLLADVTVGQRAGYGPRPQNVPLPWISLKVVSDPAVQILKKFQDRRQSRVQVDVRAETRADVIALRKAVIAALAPGGLFHGITFGRANFTPVRDLGEPTETGFVHRDSFDVMVWHD